MKVLSVAQVREADAYTIANEPVSSADLMERAGLACAVWLLKQYGRNHHYLVFCGNGNNGGDGLVIARHLADNGCHVETYIVRAASSDSQDFTVNLSRLHKQGRVTVSVFNTSEDPVLPVLDDAIVVDAIFGSGLSREPEGVTAEIIDAINATTTDVVAIDIPSGLFGDDNLQNSYRHVIHATHTLTFQQPKLSFFFAENSEFTGRFHVLDIGLHRQFLEEAETPYYFVTKEDARKYIRPRAKFSHKGTFGHALLIAGGKGKMGAAVLATRACLRAGAGLVTAYIPSCGESVLQSSVPEAMLLFSESETEIAGTTLPEKFSAIGIGPGIGASEQTANALKQLLQNFNQPLVCDADALNILAQNPTWLEFLPENSVLTPHPGEFDRLAGKQSTGYERMETQREMAMKLGVFIVLKGAYTSIACPDGTVYFNSTGNPGMATGGSGDVLTGIITGLLAQGFPSEDACVLGVYLHGLAGDLAAAENSEEALIAGDLVTHLGQAWKRVRE